MEGYEVMPALQAAERGDVFVTVTGGRDVLRREHFERMKDNAVLANAGHFDVELDLGALRELAVGGVRDVRPLVEQYDLGEGRRLNLLARGRVVNPPPPRAILPPSWTSRSPARRWRPRSSCVGPGSSARACTRSPRGSTARSPTSSWRRWASRTR